MNDKRLIDANALMRDVMGLTIVSPEAMNYANAVAVAIANAPHHRRCGGGAVQGLHICINNQIQLKKGSVRILGTNGQCRWILFKRCDGGEIQWQRLKTPSEN